MCQAIQELVQDGRMEGRMEGQIEGRLEGRIEGIVLTCKEFGITFDDVVGKIISRFDISDKEAKEKVNEYWNA